MGVRYVYMVNSQKEKVELIGETAEQRFGELEINYFHGELIPGNHQILEKYSNMPLEDIPIGAVIGVALATARGLNGNDDNYVDNNRSLIWNGNWYEDKCFEINKSKKNGK